MLKSLLEISRLFDVQGRPVSASERGNHFDVSKSQRFAGWLFVCS